MVRQKGFDFGVRLLDGSLSRSGKRHAAIGYGMNAPCEAGTLKEGTSALLTQTLRNPRAGTYTITAHVCGGGSAADYREFLAQFRCRLVLFGYRDLSKDSTKNRREFESVEFTPVWTDTPNDYKKVTLTRKLRSQDGGASEIEMGVGVAILVEKKTPGAFTVAAGRRAFIRVDDVTCEFIPRPRNDDVTV